MELTATTFASAAADGVSNGSTPVTLVGAPGASTQRQVKLLTVFNADTVAATVTIRYKDGANVRRLCAIALAVGSTLIYTDGEGFRVLDAAGSIVSSLTGSSVALLTADPASPADDSVWIVRTGSSPTMTVALKARIAGTTYTIASITL